MSPLRCFAIAMLSSLNVASAQAVELRPLKPGSWRDILQSSNAQPTIIHVWGLTCGICIAELPEWGKFSSSHPEIKVILINWDRKTESTDKIVGAISKSKLENVEHWVLGDGFADKLRFEIDPSWLGEMPYTKLVDGQGNITTISGAADFRKLASPAHWK
jgi:hypothetical protein